MRRFIIPLFAAALSVAGCMESTEQAVAPSATASTPLAQASSASFGLAQQAAAACGQEFPSVETTISSLKSMGFARIGGQTDYTYLQSASSEVIAIVGRDGPERVCIVGLKNMTPAQSYELAQPWVRQFGALTNAERGQGLSDKVVQAWASLRSDRKVYVAAYKSWAARRSPFPRGPGASVRLIYIPG